MAGRRASERYIQQITRVRAELDAIEAEHHGHRDYHDGARDAVRRIRAALDADPRQALVAALGSDGIAEVIAAALTVHGHDLAAVRLMTDAALLAVAGIDDTYLARIRQHFPAPQ
jgi:hypothetical protein